MAILTISRQFGSGAEEIGKMVAQALGYHYIDRETILEDIKQAGSKWEEKAKYFDENYPQGYERHDWWYWGFVALNQRSILNHALENNAVIMGRGGNFLLKGVKHHLGVRVEAPLRQRLEKIMKTYALNQENAHFLIEKADQEMAGAVYLIYGRRWDAPGEYDMFIDTGIRSLDEVVGDIKGVLVEKDKLNTPESKNILILRARAATVKAAIATDPSFFLSLLTVEPKEEGLLEYGLILRAIVHTPEEIPLIKESARKIAGDLPIECEVHYQQHSRFG